MSTTPTANTTTQIPFLINVPVQNNLLLKRVIDDINANEEISTLWKVANTNAIDRLGYSDHGPVHVQIVANIALRLMRILLKRKVQMSSMKDFDLTAHHAELIVVLAALFHDLGMSIHRSNHEEFSITLAHPLLQKLLAFLPVAERTIIISEVLHAIISHRSKGDPFTVEGAIVRASDALDITGGRAKVPFNAGRVDIHSVSAMAIEKVSIREGKDTPIEIEIIMSNLAGVFQIDELLLEKLRDSKIEQYLHVRVYLGKRSEQKIITEFPELASSKNAQ